MGKGKERKKLEQIFATNNNSPLSLRCAAAEYEFAYDAPIGFPKHIGKQHLWAVPTLHAPSARQHSSSGSSSSNSLQMRIKFPCWSIGEPGIEWELLCMAGVGRGGWRMCYLLFLLPSWQISDRVQQTERQRERECAERVAHPGNLQRKLSTLPIVCLGASDAYHRHHKTIFYAACFGLEITPKWREERAKIAGNREQEMEEERREPEVWAALPQMLLKQNTAK